jgi:hypothetical protein
MVCIMCSSHLLIHVVEGLKGDLPLMRLQGQYRKAHELKVAADAMYHEELASTQAAWDSEVALHKTRLLAKQQGEAAGRVRTQPVARQCCLFLSIVLLCHA